MKSNRMYAPFAEKEDTSHQENEKRTNKKNHSDYSYDTTKLFGDKIRCSEEQIMLTSVRYCLVSGYVPRGEMDENQLEYNTMATIDNCNTDFLKASVI